MKPTTMVLTLISIILLSTIAVSIQILSTTTKPYVPQNQTTDCRPACMNKNSYSEGWYYSCNNTFIKYSQCQYCGMACMNARNQFEGWYDTCTGLPIVYADCNKTVAKTTQTLIIIVNTAKTTTTTTTIPVKVISIQWGDTSTKEALGSSTTTTTTVTTTTTTIPSNCKPVCIRKTPQLKGWFDPCTGKLVKQAMCSHCKPLCLPNKTIEGWYDDCNGKFITPADCY
ncbi:MAG: hypothetical protein V1703_00635 [Candidatus Altiarchaeota archaeon]